MSLILVGQWSTCFRRLFSVQPTLRPVPYRHMADEHRRALLPACTPAAYLMKSLSPRCSRAAVALPRDHASRRQGHWPSPLPSTRLIAACSTSPRLCPALECPARLGCSRPRLETRSASLSPRRRPPLQCLCMTRRLTLSPPPTAFNPRPSSPLSYPRHPRKPPPSLLSLASLCLIHLSQDSERKPPPFPFPP